MTSRIKKPFHPAVPYVLLALAVLGVYSNVYSGEFLFDDETLILRNQFIVGQLPLSELWTSSAGAGAGIVNNFYRPLQILLYVLVNELFGLSAPAFHALNVGLHLANALLVYTLGTRLGFKPIGVFLASLIWALHPLHTEAVTYMSATADTLHVTFCLIALLIMLPDFSLRRVLWACFLFILALLSKETSVVLPLLASTCIFLLSPKRLKPKTYLELWPLWVLGLVFAFIRLFVLDFQKHDTSFETNPILSIYAGDIMVRIYTALSALPHYFSLLLYPVGLHYERQFPITIDPWRLDVMLGFAIVAIAVAQIVWGRGKRGLPISWAILWFISAHSLNAGVIMRLNALFLEHWMYLPSIGLCLGLGQSLAQLFEKKKYKKMSGQVAVIAILLAALLGILTYRQNFIWQNAFTFYPNILKYKEPSVRALNNLAKAYA
ncbi:MAG: hypothetical protein WAO98_08835, partial [Alphaproteobacteria bacterium]